MSDKQAISKNLWAPIHTPARGNPWINWRCVRPTRRGALAALLENISPEHHKRHLKFVRFARVTITEEGHD